MLRLSGTMPCAGNTMLPANESMALTVFLPPELCSVKYPCCSVVPVLQPAGFEHSATTDWLWWLAEIRPAPLPVAQTQLPSSLNYQLLARRPDLQASALECPVVNKTNRRRESGVLPGFRYQSVFGFGTLYLDDLFDHSSQQANIFSGLYLPIFSGG